MKREELFIGQKVLDGNEVVTVVDIFSQQNPSPSNDIVVEDDNGISYTAYHCNLDIVKVWINYNDETGIWQHSVQVVGDSLWIDSFDTEEKAIIFCHNCGLQIV